MLAFCFSVAKITCVHFCCSLVRCQNPTLKINRFGIQNNRKVLFQVLLFDRQLTWKRHRPIDISITLTKHRHRQYITQRFVLPLQRFLLARKYALIAMLEWRHYKIDVIKCFKDPCSCQLIWTTLCSMRSDGYIFISGVAYLLDQLVFECWNCTQSYTCLLYTSRCV